MRIYKWMVLASLLILAGCGSGGGDFEDEDLWQKTFHPGTALTITLDSGSQLALPATALTEETKVLFSDVQSADDAIPDYFPTATKESNDMLGGVVINTPVDAEFNASIPVTIAMKDWTTAPVVLTDTAYVVYRFDFEENRWNRWGDLLATTNSTGTFATLTLPSAGFIGFLGTIAIFEGMTYNALGAAAPTYIEGTVRNLSNTPLGTDVAVYQLIGDVKYPVNLSVDNTGAYVPTFADPRDSTQAITAACLINSDSTDGTFSIVLPWRLIGSLVRLEFGRQTAGHSVQDEFVIDYPLPFENADWGEEVSAVAIAYGRNTVSPEPVLAGS